MRNRKSKQTDNYHTWQTTKIMFFVNFSTRKNILFYIPSPSLLLSFLVLPSFLLSFIPSSLPSLLLSLSFFLSFFLSFSFLPFFFLFFLSVTALSATLRAYETELLHIKIFDKFIYCNHDCTGWNHSKQSHIKPFKHSSQPSLTINS